MVAMNHGSLLPLAQAGLAHGLCVIPPEEDGSKKPIGPWRTYEHRLPTATEIQRWFPPSRQGIGVIAGAVSGNLEVLDFDNWEIYQVFLARAQEQGLDALVSRIRAGYEEQTPKPGAHLLWRCATIEGNSKLAQTPDMTTLIETRGEGGFCILAPSHGSVHASGKPYRLLQGGWSSIATITPEERGAIFTLCRSFDHAPSRPEYTPTATYAPRNGTRPGDLFAAATPWRDILEPHGWHWVQRVGEVDHWRRPGKQRDKSATTNYAGSDCFYCFSSSTVFDTHHGYGKFSVYALLNHNGDYGAAAEALARKGFREQTPPSPTQLVPPVREQQSEKIQPSQLAQDNALLAIVSNGRPLREVSDDALNALRAYNSPPVLFARLGAVVRVTNDERQRPIIQRVDTPTLRGHMTRSADYVRRTVKEKKQDTTVLLTHIPPPYEVAEDILTLPHVPFPPLLGVVESPVLRSDGSILSTPGYDRMTRLFYMPATDLHLPLLPTDPTGGAAEEAAFFLINEVLCDFPFLSPADLANYLACLLTPIVRPAIDGHTPLCLIDKPTPGSGAGLLADLVAIGATGGTASKTTPPTGKYAEAEWKKMLTSILFSGQQVVVFDNLEDVLSSPHLCSVITTKIWSDRLLGKTETLTLDVRCSWIATGNNISLGGDMPRRCYRVFIDPKVEKPQERQGFKHPDLLSWAQKHRGEMLAALLTMTRAWFLAGKPPARATHAPFGSFEEWQHIIGGILAYAGVHGFLENQQDLYTQTSTDADQWAAFLHACFEAVGARPVTVRYLAGLLQTAAPDSPLIIALPESLQWDEKNIEKSRQAVGSALKKRALRIFGGYRIERGPTDSHNKTATWSILKVSRECGDLRGLAGSLLYPAREKKIDKNFLGMKEWKKSRKSPQVPARVKR